MNNISAFSSLKAMLGNKVQFASILTVTDPKMNKGGRKNKETGEYPNPMFNSDGTCRVMKRTKTVVMLNNNYASAVSNRTEKTSGERKEFDADGMSGREWVEGYENLISKATNGSDTLYLRTYFNMGNNNTPHVEYLVDGRLATDDELEIIKSYLPKKSESKKQAEVGLSEEEQIMPRDYKVSSLRQIDCGEYHFSQ